MNLRSPFLHGLLVMICATAPAARAIAAKSASAPAVRSTPAPAPSTPEAPKYIVGPDGRRLEPPPPGGWLPDTAVICRVGPRRTTAKNFVDAYFDAYVPDRPGQDSLGRVQFLQSLVNKDVLGMTALEINRPFDFEDRLTMREYANRIYSNVLYRKEVLERVRVSDEQVKQAYEMFKAKIRVRRIVVSQRAAAEALRSDLNAGRITWAAAVRKYSITADREQEGDLGWSDPTTLSIQVALKTYPLRPGEVSPPIPQREGYMLTQVVDRHAIEPPDFDGIASYIRTQLSDAESARLADSLTVSISEEIHLAVDSANVAWAAQQFAPAQRTDTENGAPVFTIDASIPEFQPADTSRILARFDGGRLSLGTFIHAYSDITPMMRPNVNDFWLMRDQVVTTALEPFMAVLAVRKGYDRDSTAASLVDRRREQLLVEHLYADSIESKVWVSPEERHAFYEKNKKSYVTFVRVTYATVVRTSRAGIDSVVARLKAGESARDIQLADSLVGLGNMGSYAERLESEHGTPYYRVLFEELRPGQWSVDGPDKNGHFQVLQVLTRQEPRQLSYEEAEQYVDESVHNLKSEARLNAFLARHKKRYPIVTHPEWVMRVQFIRPS